MLILNFVIFNNYYKLFYSMHKTQNLFLLSLFIFYFTNFSMSQCATLCRPFDPVSIPKEHNVDFKHLKLTVDFVPEKKLVIGSVIHSFSILRDRVDSIFLDGPGINVKTASIDDTPIRYKTTEEGFYFYPNKSLTWGGKHELKINYEATPKKGIYFIGWNDSTGTSQKQIWTQGQAFDNRYWIPCFDLANDKVITEVIVNFDSNYKVLSNGRKINQKIQSNGKTTWHYTMSHPHATYLIMLGIGKYESLETKSKSGVPLQSWYYPNYKNRVESTYKFNTEIFNFLEDEIGIPYPWESYAQIPVQDFMYGAMENTTATIFGDFFQVDPISYNDANYVSINAHELAHQWFGDLVTARTTTDLWLQESFATYYNQLAEKKCFGEDHYAWVNRQACNSALATTDKKPLAFSNIPTTLVYQKGSQVLAMLRYTIGDSAYRNGIKKYLSNHAYGNVDSEDLLTTFHDETGFTLDWFWEQWIYNGGEPNYHVDFEELESKGELYTQINTTQKATSNSNRFFKMPILFEIYYKDGTKISRQEWVEQEHHSFKFNNPKGKKIDFILFDPGSSILKNVTFNKTFEQLSSQALKASNLIDRYDAILALKSYPINQKINLFKDVYNKEKFYLVKNEIIQQIIHDTTSSSLELILESLKDSNIKVRKNTVLKTNRIHPTLEQYYTKLLNDSSYVLIANCLDRLCSNFPENSTSYFEKTANYEGTYGKNVRFEWLKQHYLINKDIKSLSELIDYSTYKHEFLTRINAFNALKYLNSITDEIITNAFEASLHANSRLAQPAKEYLTYFAQQVEHKQRILQLIKEYKCSTDQKVVLEKLCLIQ